MKKLFLFLFLLIPMLSELVVSQATYTATVPLFSYATTVATTSLWIVQPSSGNQATVYIDTTRFYRTGIIDLSACDSINLSFFTNDTICAKVSVWTTDGVNYADSCTSFLDSVKIASSTGGRSIIHWAVIQKSLFAGNAAGHKYEAPLKVRFTVEFYTSGTQGANNHCAHKSRYQSLWLKVKYFR
jgi:hypothetical protein